MSRTEGEEKKENANVRDKGCQAALGRTVRCNRSREIKRKQIREVKVIIRKEKKGRTEQVLAASFSA